MLRVFCSLVRTVGVPLVACAALIAALGVVIFACGGRAASAPPVTRPAPLVPYEGCLERKQPVAEDQTTPLGVSSRDLLHMVLGEHRAPIHWRDLSQLDYAREGEDTLLRVHVTRASGATVFIHREPNPEPDPAGFGPAHICEDMLRIPVHVSAATEDGLLKLEFDTTLVATDEASASLSWQEPTRSSRASQTLQAPQPPQLAAESFVISLGFTERGMTGLMRGSYQPRDETQLLASHVDFTCFPQGLPPQEHGFSFPGCQD